MRRVCEGHDIDVVTRAQWPAIVSDLNQASRGIGVGILTLKSGACTDPDRNQICFGRTHTAIDYMQVPHRREEKRHKCKPLHYGAKHQSPNAR